MVGRLVKAQPAKPKWVPILALESTEQQKINIILTCKEYDKTRMTRRIIIPKIKLITENAVVEKRLQGRFSAFRANFVLYLYNQNGMIGLARMAIGAFLGSSDVCRVYVYTILFQPGAQLFATLAFICMEVAHVFYEFFSSGVVLAFWGYFLRIVDELSKDTMNQCQRDTRFPIQRAVTTIESYIIFLQLFEFRRLTLCRRRLTLSLPTFFSLLSPSQWERRYFV
jgi:hypothetical protein